jgi:hypothetical protein
MQDLFRFTFGFVEPFMAYHYLTHLGNSKFFTPLKLIILILYGKINQGHTLYHEEITVAKWQH